MADEQEALLAQIRALSGAIDQRKSTPQSVGRGGRGYGQRGGSSSYHRGGDGGRGRGAYLGGYYHGGHTPLPSRHRTLVLSGPQTSGSAQFQPAQANAKDDESEPEPGPAAGQEGWVKRKSTHNMSLVSSKTFEKTEPARLAAIAATQTAKKASKANSTPKPKPKPTGQASVRRGDNMGEVIIDGVTFEFDETGTKLVKKTQRPASEVPEEGGDEKTEEATATDGPTSTPLRTSVNGQNFVRTKTGNLISQALLDQRRENKRNSAKLKRLEQMGKEIAGRQALRSAGRGGAKRQAARKKTLCAYFNKTGQCKNGLSCPYKHDLSRLAICPRTLRPSGCPLPSGTCPLSHEPKPERIPHCVHYLANAGACRKGDACTYTHPSSRVELSNESPICMDFSDFGWCNNGRDCTQRHTWDCPEFLRKGKCERRGCKLMHVVRVPSSGTGTRQLDDDELFVRDDEAHVHPDGRVENEEHQQHQHHVQDQDSEEQRSKKRKRGQRVHEMPIEDDVGEDEADEREANGISFKTHKSKAFSKQDDFISFDDLDEDVDEEDQERGTHEPDSDVVEGEDDGEGSGREDDEDLASVQSDSPDEGSDIE